MTIEIANRLCSYRKQAGFSQEELAEKVGVSRQAVSKWERAEASPDTDNLILLSRIYGVTLDELLNIDPQGNVPKEESDNTVDGPDFKEEPEVNISLKNGIHINNAKNGDKVNIDIRGINVEDRKGAKVHLDLNGIHVEDRKGAKVHLGLNGIHIEEDGHIHSSTNKDENIPWNNEMLENRKKFRYFPLPIICCIAYLLMGIFNVLGGWAFGWIIFFIIPIYHSLYDAIITHNPSKFCYPVLSVMIYLICGFYIELWHPTWIIFLTIPLYYAICDSLKKE